MKKIFLLVACAVSVSICAQNTNAANSLSSQVIFLRDVTGVPLAVNSNMVITGSPYFNKDYCVANIKVASGKRYNGIDIKLNLQENKLIYRMADGQEQESSVIIDWLEITQCEKGGKPVVFRCGYPPTGRQTLLNYYQVLDSGKLQLLKHWNVTYMDQKPYGTASVQRTYESSPVYYVYSPEKGMIVLGKNENTLLELLADKKNEVSAFISSQNIRIRKEDDLIRVFAFYNGAAK